MLKILMDVRTLGVKPSGVVIYVYDMILVLANESMPSRSYMYPNTIQTKIAFLRDIMPTRFPEYYSKEVDRRHDIK